MTITELILIQRHSIKQLLFILIVFPFIAIKGITQNLVPNPSFEDYTVDCENHLWGPVDPLVADLWESYRGSTDHINPCNFSYWTAMGGYQSARTGDSFAAFGVLVDMQDYPNCREMIGIELASPLVINQTYYVELHLSLASGEWTHIACNKLGALFLTQSYYSDIEFCPGTCNTCLNYLPNFAHVYTEEIIDDTNNWAKISGCFTADSNYTHLAIGNFFTDDNVTYNTVPGGYPNYGLTYYYLDDVSVEPLSSIYSNNFDSLFCLGDTIQLSTSQPASYQWSNNRFTSYYSPSSLGSYSVKININDCIVHDTFVIENDCPEPESHLDMPNIFTPNGDGRNEYFQPIKLENIEVVNFLVHNRWGGKIYGASDKIQWNGKALTGENVPDGIYYWIIYYKDIKGEIHNMNGYVHLNK